MSVVPKFVWKTAWRTPSPKSRGTTRLAQVYFEIRTSWTRPVCNELFLHQDMRIPDMHARTKTARALTRLLPPPLHALSHIFSSSSLAFLLARLSALRFHCLQVVQLPRLRARHHLRPAHRDAHQRGRRVEGAAGLEAQSAAVRVRLLSALADSGGVSWTFLDHLEGLRIPDFDRLVVRAGHNRLAVR